VERLAGIVKDGALGAGLFITGVGEGDGIAIGVEVGAGVGVGVGVIIVDGLPNLKLIGLPFNKVVPRYCRYQQHKYIRYGIDHLDIWQELPKQNHAIHPPDVLKLY